MMKQACLICKVGGVVLAVGGLNWVAVGFFNVNLVEQLFGIGTIITKIVYALVGLSALGLLASFFMTCPACKKS